MKENKKELIKLISKIAVALAVFVFVLINYKELVNIDVREIVSAAPSLLPAVLSVLAIYCVKGLGACYSGVTRLYFSRYGIFPFDGGACEYRRNTC